MQLGNLILFLLIGTAAGWIAAKAMRGTSFGLTGNLVIGAIGSLLGGHLFQLLGLSTGGLIGSLVTAVVGAIVLIFVVGVLKRV